MSELPDAAEVARFNGAEHHALEIDLATDPDSLARLAWHLDEPLADLSAVGFLALSSLASRHVTVALSGQGADELFGGYRKHRVAALAQSWGALPGPVAAASVGLLRRGAALARRVAEALVVPNAGARLLGSSAVLQPDLRHDLFAGALAEHAHAAERVAAGHLAAAPGATPLEAALYLDAKLGSSTTCSRTSIAPRWPARSRSGSRSSTTSWSSCVRASPRRSRSTGCRASTSSTRRPTSGCLDRAVVHRVVRDLRGGRRALAPLVLSLVMLELWLGETLPRALAARSPALELVA